jgi:hypothetical protein
MGPTAPPTDANLAEDRDEAVPVQGTFVRLLSAELQEAGMERCCCCTTESRVMAPWSSVLVAGDTIEFTVGD